MQVSKPLSTALRALPFAVVPLAISLLAAAPPAQAQILFAEARAGSATYVYNTSQGEVAATGNGSGGVGLGGGNVTAFASSDEGLGAFHGTQSVSASADYATAGVHIAIATDGYSEGNGRAQINDNVTFNVFGGNANTVTHIGLDLTLTGTISTMQHVSYLYALKMFGQGGPLVGWETVLYDSPTDDRNYVGWAVSGGAGAPAGFDSWELLAGTATEKHLHGVFSFTGAQSSYDLILGFNMRCSVGTDCDFGNSGHLSFDLPAGVSLTSASGLLLTGNVAPAVPEPQTYALMLAGLGLVGWFARRRR